MVGATRCAYCGERRTRRIGAIVCGVIGAAAGVANFFVPGLVAFVAGAIVFLGTNLAASWVMARLEDGSKFRSGVYISLDPYILLVCLGTSVPVCLLAFLPQLQEIQHSIWFRVLVVVVLTLAMIWIGSKVQRLTNDG